MTVPSWVQDSIFYQIFPDRFMDGDESNNPPVVLPWNRSATLKGFMGGDLRGIIQRLDYLLDLGINAIYLNPIFQSPSNHRYNTVDYFTIDDKLGNLQDFHELVEAAHRNGIRIILDGVFNHTARGFFAFNDILENGAQSPYLDWYHIKHIPVNAYSPGEAKDYDAWWNFKSLPKLNTANARVRAFIMRIGKYWIEQGADGWRLDVPNEIDDDAFWAEFRQVVKSANPEAYLVGEIWDALPRWVGETHFDGLMDYPFRTATLGLLTAHWTPSRYAQVIEKLLATYPPENNHAMFILLGSHDTERVLTMLEGDIQKLKLATLMQFAFPGAPSIYYGDEIGLKGGKDPDCRSGFPWDEAYWNSDLRDWYKKLIRLRKESNPLRRGGYKTVIAEDAQSLYAFARLYEDETVITALNTSAAPCKAALPVSEFWQDGRVIRNPLDGTETVVSGGSVSIDLPAWGGVWLG